MKGISFMRNHRFGEKYENGILMVLTIVVNVAFLSAGFGYFYDLNDDMLMKDIMAGVYSGIPDGHNMQTLYILGMLISLCYRLCREFPWYGLFLLLCQMGSLCLIGARLLYFCRKKWEKAGCMLLVTVFFWGVLLPHMTALHYTYTSAMLAASALFCFIMTPDGLAPGSFIRWNIPSILFVILAYQIRTEMLLLVLPLICLAGLFRWGEEEKIWQQKNFCQYGIILGSIVIGMLISRLIDFAAYGSEDWQKFLTFFEKRTEIYDYHMDVVTSGEHAGYLRSIGLEDAQQELLANYNFGLDEEIDEEVLSEIADYAMSMPSDRIGAADIAKAFWLTCYRTVHDVDAPYGRLAVYGYLGVALIGICNALSERERPKRWAFLWELLALGAVRTLLWMFLLLRGRYPVRVTHSLCLAETVLLLGMLCRGFIRFRKTGAYRQGTSGQEAYKRERMYQVMQNGGLALIPIFALLCAAYFPKNVENVRADMAAKSLAHQSHLEVERYCKAHPGNFYFLDVYSTVGFSQKVFQDVDNTVANYDMMGGWICKSPLYQEKLEWFGMTSMEEALLHDDTVFFIIGQGEDAWWLPAYYEEKGIAVDMRQVDSIAGTYEVWKVISK